MKLENGLTVAWGKLLNFKLMQRSDIFYLVIASKSPEVAVLAARELKTSSMGSFGFEWQLSILVDIPEPPVKKV